VKRARPSTWKPRRSSKRWKEALEGDEASGTRWRELGKLQWQAAMMARGAEVRERERERESAHGVEARMASALALSTGKGGGRGVGERACHPRGAVGLTRSGARATRP